MRPAYDWSCDQHWRAGPCQQLVIEELNHARSVMGLPAYGLPRRFKALKPIDQLLVLSNSDRAAYKLPLIVGRNRYLDASAQRGANNHTDPAPALSGWHAYAANWAGYTNPLLGYYAWMYYDGLNSGNLDCTSKHRSGCWGHRHNVLYDFGGQEALGVGHAPSSWTQLFEWFASVPAGGYVPTVTAVCPRTGGRGTAITVAGAGFVRVQSVTIGGVQASVHVVSAHRLTVTAPAHASGTVHVVVATTGGGSARTLADTFVYP